ncbi:Mannan endo-1,4-beta-mannosidase 7 [Sesamum angolense]|uniref:mannan endo-1,4-beta-mannosidase n=1 Tax=Sesamum angolense TaxID=2727404 RepID=A0AAE1WCJ5_9LAMI|nr:Mannan endo-1,4-beta-mannosidase 7 [Sesamum angolense]
MPEDMDQTFLQDLENRTSTESVPRCKARLERHKRIMEQAAKALAEKNMRDLLAQKEQAERNRLAESFDADIKRWATQKEGNLHALLSTLQYILGPDCSWQPISLTEIIATAARNEFRNPGSLRLVYKLQKSHFQATAEDGFITVEREHFILNGSRYYAHGFNAYWLMYVASDPSQRYKISSAFQQAANHGLEIARTWAFRDGGFSPLQYSPGSYNEHMFQGLDFVVSEAGKYGIKLILSLVNNYEDSGGKKQYVSWARNQGQNLSSDDDFFTNSAVNTRHIKAVLTRENSITGIAYKDDPTIMAWELMNEPRCSRDPSGSTVQAWIAEMASYLKSIDRNHLLEAGLEGFYGQSDAHQQQNNPQFQMGTDFITNNQIPDIDFATVHSYPDQWLTSQSDEAQLSFLNDWLNSHIQDVQTVLQKPLLFAEFGKSCKDAGYDTYKRDELFNTVYSAIYSSARGGGVAAGGLFWQLLTEGMDNFRDGYEIVFSESPSTASLIAEQSQKLNKIRQKYARLRF